MPKFKQIWVLKTPGGEVIRYDEPMTMDWTVCGKQKFIQYEAYEHQEAVIDNLREMVKAFKETLKENKIEY